MSLAVLAAALIFPLAAFFSRRRDMLAWIRSNREEFKVFAGLLAVYGLIVSATFLNASGPVHDNRNYHYPLFIFVLASLRHFSEFPLWNPYMNGGLPTIVLVNNFYLLIADRIPFYFLAAFSSWLPNSMLLYKANLISHCLLLAGFMVLFLKEILPSRAALYWGAMLSLFSGITTGTLPHEQMAASILFAPLLLFLAVRLYRTRRLIYALLFGLFLGHSFCNHYPHLIAYLLFIFLVSFCIACPGRMKDLFQDKPFVLRASALIFLSCLLMTAIPLYAYVEFAHRLTSPLRGNQLDIAYESMARLQENSFNPDTFLTYLVFHFTRLERWGHGNISFDRAPFYIGLLGIASFIYGCCLRKVPYKRFWLLSFLGILLFALGCFSFVYALLYRFVPIARLQRVPLHMANYMNMPIIVISSFGFDAFASWVRKKTGQQKSMFSKRILASVFLLASVFVVQLTDLGIYLYSMTRMVNGSEPEAKALSRLERPSFSFGPEDAYWARIAPVSHLLTFKNTSTDGTGRVRADVPSSVARILDQSMDRLSLETVSRVSTRLIWAMNFDQGWEAWVDEHPIAIERAVDGHMAILLPAGRHRVRWEYAPLIQSILIHSQLLFCGAATALLVLAV